MNHLTNTHYLSGRTIDLISSDATNVITDSHVVWHLENKIVPPEDTHLIVGLLSMNLPYSWYTIRTGRNTTFTISTTVSGVDYSVDFTIADGNYTGQTFASALNTLFTTQKGNLGLTTLGINLDTTKNIYYLTMTPNPTSFTISNVTCYKEMGISSSTGLTFSGASPYYFDKQYDLSGDKSIYVQLHSKGLRNINTKNISNILANVPCICPSSNTLYYMPHVVEYFRVEDDLTTIEVELLDEDMLPIGDFAVSNPFRLTLSVHFSYNKYKPVIYKEIKDLEY